MVGPSFAALILGALLLEGGSTTEFRETKPDRMDSFLARAAVPPPPHDSKASGAIRDPHADVDPYADVDGNLQWAKSAMDELAKRGVHNPVGAASNFCDNGKLLPSFYLLGGPKCATTSLSSELGSYGGVRSAPVLWSPKEWKFWESINPGIDEHIVTRMFRDALGKCPDVRLVLGDYSVNNLAAVRHPENLDMSPCSCDEQAALRSRSHGVVGAGADVPRLLNSAYGPRAREITFMIMLREPLSRIQSSWYHAKADNFAAWWGFRDCCTTSFNRAMRTILDASNKTVDPPTFRGKLGGEGSVWASMFGLQLKEYMEFFLPAQMMIVPYKQFVNHDQKLAVCAELRKRLAIGLNCTNHPDVHENVHEHPPLVNDLQPKVLQLLEKMFEPERKRLVRVILKAHRGGAYLAGFGVNSNLTFTVIDQWLTNNW